MTSKKNPDVTVGTVTLKGDSPFAMLIPQLQDLLSQVKVHDEKLAGLAGTHAARKAAALATLTQNDENAWTARVDLAGVDSDLDSIDVSDLPTIVLQRATEALEIAKSNYDDARQALNEAVDAALRADKDANTSERDSIVAAREALVTSAAAMATLIAGASKPITASDLGLSKPKGTGSTGGHPGAKTSKGTFSYRRDGDAEWTVPCDAQQSLSATAYRVFGKTPIREFRSIMAEAAGGPVDETKDYEVHVTAGGVTGTVKFVVTPNETPES